MPGPKPFTFETRIRFIDTDASRRIHYTCMFRYFESAEIEFLRTLGLTYAETEVSFPRVHVECDYRSALQYDDLIQIEVRLMKLSTSSAALHFRTLKDGFVAAEGNVVIVCMDRRTQRSAPIPEEMRLKLLPALEESEAR